MINSKSQLYARFIKLLLPYRGKWVLILILSALAALLGLVIPYLTKEVVDIAIGKNDFRAFIIYAIIGGIIFAVAESLNWLRYWLERTVKLKVSFDLHKKVFKHLQGLSFAWFQDKSTGEHIFKINYDIDAVTEFITNFFPQAVLIILRAGLILVIVFYLNWKMAICALILAPFLFLPPYFYGRLMEKLSVDLVESSEKVLSYLQEVFSHIFLVKVWASEKKNTRIFLNKVISNIRATLSYLKSDIKNGIAVEIITKLIIGLISFYGGYLVLKEKMTLGSLTAIMVYLTQLVGLQAQFAGFWQTSISGYISCGRLALIFDTQPQIQDQADGVSVEFSKGDLEFEGVSFGYRPHEAVIKNISFAIKGGEYVALVGASGCGKTTILNLLIRIYDPWVGSIKIDNHDIRAIKLQALKNQFGVALQEHFLWDDTIYNNITYNRSGATREEVEEVSCISGVNEFVKELPQGYHTVIGENACKLSEGQKQKISIARALFKKPKILVLDEAMSSMDSASEEKIVSNIKERYKQMTVIIVSHRFSAIKNCDRLIYLSASDTVIEGSVETLLKDNESFRKLFAGQLQKESA